MIKSLFRLQFISIALDVIDIQLALTQAKTNQPQALYDYNANKAKLEKSMGIRA
jgi:outer membrane protein